MSLNRKLSIGICLILVALGACTKENEDLNPGKNQVGMGMPPTLSGIYSDKYTIEIVSGDNQVGVPDVPLTEPLKVRVINSVREQVTNPVIHFSGDGQISNLTVDQAGNYRFNWSP